MHVKNHDNEERVLSDGGAIVHRIDLLTSLPVSVCHDRRVSYAVRGTPKVIVRTLTLISMSFREKEER